MANEVFLEELLELGADAPTRMLDSYIALAFAITLSHILEAAAPADESLGIARGLLFS